MPTRNVVLPPHLSHDIDVLIETGRYQNFSEVMRAGLRLLLQQEAEQSAKLEALKQATSRGIMQLENGEYDELDSDELQHYFEALGQQVGEKH
ncbi:putative addiction module antidote protein [compost metagenome]